MPPPSIGGSRRPTTTSRRVFFFQRLLMGALIGCIVFLNFYLVEEEDVHDEPMMMRSLNHRHQKPPLHTGVSDSHQKTATNQQLQQLQQTPPLLPRPVLPKMPPVTSLKLPTPVFVVGMPKVGTSSIHAMFACSGVKSSHYCCGSSNRTHTHCNDGGDGSGTTFTCARCIQRNLRHDLPVLQGCGNYTVFAQMDAEQGKGIYLPQHFALEELHAYAPNATWILNTRPPEAWVKSIRQWFHLGQRFLNTFHVSDNISPNYNNNSGMMTRSQALEQIFVNHTKHVLDFLKQNRHQSHALVQVDISDPNAGSILANAFGIHETCWARLNQNKQDRTTTADVTAADGVTYYSSPPVV